MADEICIDSLGTQGDGVASDGTFVAGALPGERVRITRLGHRGILGKILTPSEARVTPPCPHFGTCGGCVLQHASDALVAQWKSDLIVKTLATRGIENPVLRPMRTSAPGTRRRLVFTGRRLKKGVTLGLHQAGSERIIALQHCAVAVPAIVDALPKLAELVGIGTSRKSEIRVHVTMSNAGLDVAVTGGKPISGPVYGQLVAVAATGNLARLSWDGEEVIVRRPPVHHIGKWPIIPPPGGFMQATCDGESALIEAVCDAVGPGRRVLDLFAGIGTFSLPLSARAQIRAIESEAAALEALDTAWRAASGLRPITGETRDLYRRPVLAREMHGIDAAVVNPPRPGARAQCIELAQSTIPRLAMVSCNIATFARDARILIDGGYRLDWIQPVDQFRWSPHIELSAAFSRP